MSILDRIKSEAKRGGGSRSEFIYFRDGEKVRIRFLDDLEDGMEVDIHRHFEDGINTPCQTIFGRSCPYDDWDKDDKMRTRTEFIWNVWDYDTNSVKLIKLAANNFSPLPQLAGMYENYGTLTDRDYVIVQNGKQLDKSFTVIPQDKKKFRVSNAKPLSREKILKLLDKAWPCEDVDDDDDDDDDNPLMDTSDEYDGKKPAQLYKMCVERDIECEKKKPAAYYINLLKEDDKANADWGDDDDDDDWDDDEDDE